MDLNIEQKKIAFSKPNGHALLKGVAGLYLSSEKCTNFQLKSIPLF